MIPANSQTSNPSNLGCDNYTRRLLDMSRDASQAERGYYTIHRMPAPGLIQGPAGANLDVTA